MSGSLVRLKELFRHFPGIGIKQSERFVYYLLGRSEMERNELAELIRALGSGIISCARCGRYVESGKRASLLCDTCADEGRDPRQLLIIEKDVDFEKIRRSGAYRGYFFILGGTVPILEKDPESKIRLSALRKRIQDDPHIEELILALSATPQGDHTAELIRREISSLPRPTTLTISMLGRGLSTGTEIEYSDDETIESALKHRG